MDARTPLGFAAGRFVRRFPHTPVVERDDHHENKTAQSALASDQGTASASAQETLSQLVARILDQLSLSAWLSSAALVFGLLVIVSVKRADGHAGRAVDGVTSMSFPSVLLLIGAVIVATTLTQAFAFDAIRILEGYWGPGRVRMDLAESFCRWQTWRRKRLMWRHVAIAGKAFKEATPKMLKRKDELTKEAINILRARAVRERLPPPEMNPSDVKLANAYDWLKDVPASPRRRLDAMATAVRRYPSEEFRILPTRLGNALRYHEEQAHYRGVPENGLEHDVEAVFDGLPTSVQVAHDHYRLRLDLYCSLVLVFAVTGAIGLGLLTTYGLSHILVTGVLASGLTWMSYRAAVASASPYGGILELIVEIRPPEVTALGD